MAEDFNLVESKVTYTTKELLQRIDARFERLETLYATAPTRGEFDLAVARLAKVEDEVVRNRTVTDTLKKERQESFSRRDKTVGAVLALVAVGVQVYAAVGGGPL